jgi:hypothetical protein
VFQKFEPILIPKLGGGASDKFILIERWQTRRVRFPAQYMRREKKIIIKFYRVNRKFTGIGLWSHKIKNFPATIFKISRPKRTHLFYNRIAEVNG